MKPSMLLAALLPLVLGCGGGGSSTPYLSPERLRFEVAAPGLYQLTFEDLQSAGYNPGLYQPGLFSLSTQGRPVALRVQCAESGAFQAGDTVSFYAEPVDNQFTGTGVYFLGQDGGGVAMTSRSVAVTGAAAPLTVCRDTLHVEQNLTAWGLAPGAPDQDYWFWQKLTAPTTGTYAFQLTGLAEQAGPSALTVCLLGGTTGGPNPDHHVRVALNGTQVGDAAWDGQNVLTQTFPLPAGLLQVGANSVVLTLPGDTGAPADLVYVNWFEVAHWQPIQAQGGAAAFSVAGGTAQPIQVPGFTAPQVSLFDLTDPMNPVALSGATVAPAGGAYQATFLDPSTTTRAYFATASIQTPSALTPWTSGLLRQPSRADYLLIAPRAFLPAAEPLLQLRRSQGLQATSVAVEDIFNEFANGLPDPQGIKDFLAFTAASWARPAPAYVLFLGDATWDYRNRLGDNKASQVPCHLSWTDELGLTPDDNWYVALDGKDLLPSMMVGRLPAATPAQAAGLVQKVIAYETATTPPPQSALFVADNNDPSFNANCDALAALLPAGIPATKIYLSAYTDFTLCTQDIEAAFNAGALLALYSGHGDDLVWAGEQVFDATKLPALTNGDSLSFIISLDCLNGWFAMPNGYCLAESVVASPGNGAIAAFASSGLGLEWELQLVSQDLFGLMFKGGGPTLGALCTGAKVQAFKTGTSTDVLTTLTLIGDPAMHLRGLP